MEHKEQLLGMLKDFISGNQEQASVTLHDYFVAKSQQVTGLAPAAEAAVETTDEDEVTEQ